MPFAAAVVPVYLHRPTHPLSGHHQPPTQLRQQVSETIGSAFSFLIQDPRTPQSLKLNSHVLALRKEDARQEAPLGTIALSRALYKFDLELYLPLVQRGKGLTQRRLLPYRAEKESNKKCESKSIISAATRSTEKVRLRQPREYNFLHGRLLPRTFRNSSPKPIFIIIVFFAYSFSLPIVLRYSPLFVQHDG